MLVPSILAQGLELNLILIDLDMNSTIILTLVGQVLYFFTRASTHQKQITKLASNHDT